jgi:glycosyltransferase involved in cell wall biosynthesis
MTGPLVSVVIPTYNAAHVIGRAIASALQQTHAQIECIVVDDYSRDDTEQVVGKLVQQDPRVKYVKNADVKGAQSARMTGCRLAQGRYIAFLDSDDMLPAKSIEIRLLPFLEGKIETGLVYGDFRTNGVIFPFKRLYGHHYREILKNLSLCGYPAILISRECYDKAEKLLTKSIPSWQDDQLVLAVAKFFPVWHCGAVAAETIGSSDSISHNSEKRYVGMKTIVELFKNDIVNELGLRHYFACKMRVYHGFVNMKYRGSNRLARLFVRLVNYFYRKLVVPRFDYIYA